MARKKKHPEHVNHERWLVSYADFVTLLFALFTALYAMSNVDKSKARQLKTSMRSAFNLDFFSGTPKPSGLETVDQFATPAVPTLGALVEIAPIAPERPTGEGEVGQGAGAGAGAGDGGKSEGDTFAEVRERLIDLAKELGGTVAVHEEKRGMVVSLDESTLFASGSAEILATARDPMARISEKLAGSGMEVIVEGHTDNAPVRGGRYASNWELSTARALTVVHYLQDQGRVDPRRLAAAGFSQYRPVAKKNKARNRRIEIVLFPHDIALEQ